MKTLAEIRSEYPQYGDLSDRELADRLYDKFYTDMERADFDKKVGLSPEGRPGALKRGFMSSYEGLKNLAGEGVPALYAGLTGDDEGKAAALQRFAARQREIDAQYPQTSLEEAASDPLGKGVSYLGEAAGGVFSMAPTLLGGGAAGLAGGALARRFAADQARKIALRSAMAGGVATGFPLEAAESYTNIKGESEGLALGAGAAKASLEFVGAAAILQNLFKKVPAAAIESFLLRRMGKEGAKGFAIEGLTEGAQQGIDQALEVYVGQNPELFSRANLLKVADAALRGGVAGSLVRGGTSLLQTAETPPPPPPPEPRGEFLSLAEADDLLRTNNINPDELPPERRIAAAERIGRRIGLDVEREAEREAGLTRGRVDESQPLYAFPEGVAGQRADIDQAREARARQVPNFQLVDTEQPGLSEFGFEEDALRREQAAEKMRLQLQQQEDVVETPTYEPVTPNVPLLESPDARDLRTGQLVDLEKLPPQQRQEPIAPPRMEEQLPPVREEPLRMPRAETQVGEAFGPRLESYISEVPAGQKLFIPAVQEAIGAASLPAVREALQPYVDMGALKLDKGGSYVRTRKVPKSGPGGATFAIDPAFSRDTGTRGEVEEVRRTVAEVARQLFGDRADLIRTVSGKELRETFSRAGIELAADMRGGGFTSTRTEGDLLTGQRTTVQAAVAEDMSPTQARNTAYHEGFHVAQRLRLISPEDVRLLRGATKQLEAIVQRAQEEGSPTLQGVDAPLLAKQLEREAYALEAYGWMRDNGIKTGFLPPPLQQLLEKVYQFMRRLVGAQPRRTVENVFDEFLRGDYAARLKGSKANGANTVDTAVHRPFEATDPKALAQELSWFAYAFNSFERAADKVPALRPVYDVLSNIREMASEITHRQLIRLEPVGELGKEERRTVTRFLDADARAQRLSARPAGMSDKQWQAVEAVRASMKDMWKERIKAYQQRFGDKADPEVLAAMRNAERVAYLPSKRWGDWGVAVRDKDGKLLYFETFSTPEAYLGMKGWALRPTQAAANYGDGIRRELEKKYPGATVGKVTRLKKDQLSEMLDARDVAEVEKIAMGLGQLEAMGLSDEDVAKYWDKIHEKVAAGSWKRHTQQRADIPGYLTERNIDRYLTSSLAAYIANGARFMAREANTGKLREAQKGVAGDPRTSRFAQGMIDYVGTPNFAVDFLKSVGYYNYLGGNFSSALLNMTQPLTTTLPYLTMVAGAKGAPALLKAYADAMRMVGTSLTWRGFRLDKKPPTVSDAEWAAVQRWFADGTIRNATLEDITGSSPQLLGLIKGDAGRYSQRFLDLLTYMFSMAEGLNRISAGLAGMRLMQDPAVAKKMGEAFKGTRFEGTADPVAAGKALIEKTQFNMNREGRPLFMRFTPAAEIATQFMSYPVKMAELWAELATQRGLPGKMGAALMTTALWTMAGAIGSVPFGEPAKEAAELLHKGATGRSLNIEHELRKVAAGVMGNEGAEVLLSGATRLAGIDTKRRASLGVIPTDETMEEVLRGPVGKMVVDQAIEAYNWHKEGRDDLAFMAFAPLALKNVYKGVYGTTEPTGPTTRSGRSLLHRPLSTWEMGAQSVGLTPKAVARAREVLGRESELIDESKDLRERYKERATAALANSIAVRRQGDEAGALKYLQQYQDVIREAADYDKGRPPEEKVRLNLKTIRQQALKDAVGAGGVKGEGRRIPKPLRGAAREDLSVYPRGR